MSREKVVPDFRQPTRMGWEALVVLLINSFWHLFKQVWFLIPVLLINTGENKRQGTGYSLLILSIILGSVSIIRAIISYFTTTIQVSDGHVVSRTGLISKRVKTIPLSRLHSLRTKSGPVYQLVDMIGVCFDTIADKDEEIEFVISEHQWATLLGAITSEEVVDKTEKEVSQEVPNEVYRMGIQDILRAALVQNHLKGLVIIGSVLVYLYGQFSEESIDLIERAYQYAEAHIAEVSYRSYLLLVPIAYIISLLLWCGMFIVRYWGLKLYFMEDKLVYEAGLFTKKMVHISRDKLVALSTKQNVLERHLGLMSIRLEQSAYVSGKKGENIIGIQGMSRPEMITEWWNRGKSESSDVLLMTAHSGRGLFWRNLLYKWMPPTVVLAIILAIFEPITLPLVMLILVVGIFESLLQFKQSKVSIYGDRVVVESGLFAHRTTVIPFAHIEHVQRKHLHLFSRAYSHGQLIIYTKAMQSTKVRSLKLSSLANAYDYLLYRITTK